MSVFFEPYNNTGLGANFMQFGGEQLGFMESMSKAYDAQVYGSNVDTYVTIMGEELQPIVDAINEREETKIQNPSMYFGMTDSMGHNDRVRERALTNIFSILGDNPDRYPEFQDITRETLEQSIIDRGLKAVQQGQEDASNQTGMGTIGGFVGTMGGVLTDDSLIESLIMTGPVSLGFNSSQALGKTMLREAIVGAGLEAQLQAGVMDWYNTLGLDYTYEDFFKMVALGGTIGAAFPVALTGVAKGAKFTTDQVKSGIQAFKGKGINAKDADAVLDQIDDFEALNTDVPEVFTAPEGADQNIINLVEAVNRNADDAELASNPAVVAAEADIKAIPETIKQEGFDTVEWDLNRTFNDPLTGGTFTGYEAALRKLYDGAKTLAWTDSKLTVPDMANKFEKKAIIILGPPAAGKSSIANPIARKHGAAIIDADEAKKLLPEYGNGVGANAVHKESKRLVEVLQAQAIDDGLNVVIPTVGSKPEIIRALIKKYKDNGYDVDLVGMDVSYTNARNRMFSRFAETGRYIPLDYIQSIGNKPLEVYNTLRKEGLADGYTQIDNNGKFGDAKPVLEDTRGLLEGVELRLRESRPGDDGIPKNPQGERRVQPSEANAEKFVEHAIKADEATAKLQLGKLPDDPLETTQATTLPEVTKETEANIDLTVEQIARDTDFETMADDEVLYFDKALDDEVVPDAMTGAQVKAELARDQQMLNRLEGCVT